MDKPGHIFDRDREWDALTRFATGPAGRGRPGAALGVVSGRRRQGKSYLLAALAQESGGMYFPATEAAEAESLRLFTAVLARHAPEAINPPLRDWNDAIARLFASFRDGPVAVIIDEFPFLSRVSPSLPSIIQRELGPGGSGQDSTVRLVLCGSAMSVMGGLLSGDAPLRGRASMELVVQPFPYREAAEFWGLLDPRLGALVHSVVGGTPAYRYELSGGDVPADPQSFDAWILRTVLMPGSALFREARYLLAEEPDIRDPAIYHSVLAAIASGNRTNGRIANYVGRRSDQINHPLNVLADSRLIRRESDLFRSGRLQYRIVEPLVTFYESVMRPRWSELEFGRAEQVWPSMRPTFESQVLGPHFETLCREFVQQAGPGLFGDHPAEVGSGTVSDPATRSDIEIDVCVLAPPEPNRPRRVLSLGEAKWGRIMSHLHLDRLARARDLLAAKNYDTRDTVLACYSGAGFTNELTAQAEADGRTRLIDLATLYGPAPA
jgi:AAA+ ATPase superfamily predicted ATPase